MDPIVLTSDGAERGEHAYLAVRERGVMITGNYSSTLNLTGIQLLGDSRLYAGYDSSAPDVLLSGATVAEADLTKLVIERGLYGQGLRTPHLRLGKVGEELDLSWSKIGDLDLSMTVNAYNIGLNLQGALIGKLYFGYDSNFKLRHLDVRDAKVSKVEGVVPAEIMDLQMSDETVVGESFARHLNAVREHLAKQRRL